MPTNPSQTTTVNTGPRTTPVQQQNPVLSFLGSAYSKLSQALNPFATPGGPTTPAQKTEGSELGAQLAGEASGGQGVIPESGKPQEAVGAGAPVPAATTAAGPKNPYSGATQGNQLQPLLNKQIAPALSQLNSIVSNQPVDTQFSKWMPQSLNSALTRMQQLTNKSLSGLMSADKSAAHDYVAGQAASEVLNILPSALIYHTLVGNLPSFQNQSGLQALWEILQNTNLQLPNPASASTSNIISALNGLVPGSSGTGAATTPSTTG